MTEIDRSGEDEDASGDPGIDAVLERVRTEPRAHWLAVLVVVPIGLILAWLHWLGLIVAGALVGFISPTVWHGLVGALGFGVVVLAVFAIGLGDSVRGVLEMAPAVYVTVVSALGLPALGALFRGIV
ncbi:hypothetical protein [Natronococcus occultus]|uniref:Uncharacterized protein n=1 Tax=Natronococcus occultus SP4 TaxID=694430 RepID=L0JZK8_9EURY|nr:hypothetical protein [Natronococcus occultus]AGB37283.1 hypothetical protein Natoc_1472 [Natronococcus occultus SP4]